MTHEATAMIPYERTNTLSIVTPLVDPAAAKEAMQQYEALKSAIVQESDIFRKRDKNGKMVEYLKKKFWRRLATFFGLSLTIVREERGFDESGKLFYRVIAQAIAPNGRTMDADGYCSMAENGKDWWPEHNIRATAVTRAKNRAISDLVGGGEVSAEELSDEDGESAAPRLKAAQGTDTRVKQSPMSDIDRSEMKRLCDALGRVYDESKVEGHEHAMQIQRALQKELDTRKAAETKERERQEDLNEDTITYSLDNESMPELPTATNAPAPMDEWKFLQDVEFRGLLNKLQVRTADAIEQFVAEACANEYGPVRSVAIEYGRRLLAANAKKATRGRGPSAIGARGDGEPVPESLESLPVGQKGA